MMKFPSIQQECPICGRPVRVRNEHLGRWVSCDHCSGKFVARAYDSGAERQHKRNALNRTDRLLHRAEELLTMCAARLGPSCCAEN